MGDQDAVECALVGQRIAIPASEWGQPGHYWGTIVQEGLDTSGAQCVGVSVDAGRTFFWPRHLVTGWLAATAELSQPGRSPKRARVDQTHDQQQLREQHHEQQQRQQQRQHDDEKEEHLGDASACDGGRLSADERQPQSGPNQRQGQPQQRPPPPTAAAAARGSATPPPAATVAPGAVTSAGGAAQHAAEELPQGAMLIARCPARRSPSSNPGSKGGAGEGAEPVQYIARCSARRSPSSSPPGAGGRRGAGGGRGAFGGGSPPPPLLGLNGGQQRYAAHRSTRAEEETELDEAAVGLVRMARHMGAGAGGGRSGSGGGRSSGGRGSAGGAAAAAPSSSGRLGPGATHYGKSSSSSGGGGGGGAASVNALPPRAPQSGHLHGLMLQARGKQPLAQIQNRPSSSAAVYGGPSKVLSLGNGNGNGVCAGASGGAGSGAGSGARTASFVGAFLTHANKLAGATRVGGLQEEAQEFDVPRNGLEAAAAGIPLGRAIY